MKPLYDPGLEFYVGKLQRGEPFSFVRYCNGEWNCLLRQQSDRTYGIPQLHMPELQAALAASILEPRTGDYYLALQNHGFLGPLGFIAEIDQWLEQHGAPDINWHFGTVFHRASEKGQMGTLVKALQARPLVVVGPEWLRQLTFATDFVPVAAKNCWVDVESIETRLRSVTAGSVISFSAGATANVLIHRLAPILGQHSWLIDFGSLWDPYCGVKSRRYHKVLSEKTMHRNLGV